MIPRAYLYLALVGLVLAAAGTGYIHGLNVEQGRTAKRDLAVIRGSQQRTEKTRERVDQANTATAAARESVRVVYRTITKEIVRYAQTDAGARRCLDADWVRQHDASAVPAAASAGPDAAADASAPTNAEALDVVVGNYAQCNAWREDLLGWQRWYHALTPPK